MSNNNCLWAKKLWYCSTLLKLIQKREVKWEIWNCSRDFLWTCGPESTVNDILFLFLKLTTESKGKFKWCDKKKREKIGCLEESTLRRSWCGKEVREDIKNT